MDAVGHLRSAPGRQTAWRGTEGRSAFSPEVKKGVAYQPVPRNLNFARSARPSPHVSANDFQRARFSGSGFGSGGRTEHAPGSAGCPTFTSCWQACWSQDWLLAGPCREATTGRDPRQRLSTSPGCPSIFQALLKQRTPPCRRAFPTSV